MNKLLLAILLTASFVTQAEEEIKGDKNHDGVLSGEEQYFRDHPTPPPPPIAPPTKQVTRAEGIKIDLETGYGKGWIQLAKDQPMPAESIQRLMEDIPRDADSGFKARRDNSNTIVDDRIAARKMAEDMAERKAKEDILWNLRMEGYRYMSPIAAEDAGRMLLDMLRQDAGYYASPQPNPSSQPNYYTPPNYYAPPQPYPLKSVSWDQIVARRKQQLNYYLEQGREVDKRQELNRQREQQYQREVQAGQISQANALRWAQQQQYINNLNANRSYNNTQWGWNPAWQGGYQHIYRHDYDNHH